MAKRRNKTEMTVRPGPEYGGLLTGISELLDQARRMSARTVNNVLTATYWEIGRRIVEYEQGGKARAEYGGELLKRLAADLTRRFGRGFGGAERVQHAELPSWLGDIADTVCKIRGAGQAATELWRPRGCFAETLRTCPLVRIPSAGIHRPPHGRIPPLLVALRPVDVGREAPCAGILRGRSDPRRVVGASA